MRRATPTPGRQYWRSSGGVGERAPQPEGSNDMSCMTSIRPAPMIEARLARPGPPLATRKDPRPVLCAPAMAGGWGLLNIERVRQRRTSEMWEGRVGSNSVGWGLPSVRSGVSFSTTRLALRGLATLQPSGWGAAPSPAWGPDTAKDRLILRRPSPDISGWRAKT
jgi:hypothetical protein